MSNVVRVKRTGLEQQPRRIQSPIKKPAPTILTQVPIQYLGEQQKRLAGIPQMQMVNKPDVFIEPCQQMRIDTARAFRGAIFALQGGQIPDYVGRVNVIIQNNSGMNIYIANKFDPNKLAAVVPSGWRLADSESISINVAEFQELYADNVASTAVIRVDVMQLLKTR